MIGEKALALLGVERYDLVLLDLNLPKKDGMTVLRTLRQTDRETRVLILSARSEVEDKVQGLDAGANDYLAKPFHLRAGGPHPQPDIAAVHPAGCAAKLRRPDL
jgi:cztR_silR_copR: heavy metal response regulator